MFFLMAVGAALSSVAPDDGAAEPAPSVATSAPVRQVDPSERVFQEWLAAFNSGDVGAIRSFYGRRRGDPDAAFAIDNAQDTCGFDPVRVESRTPLSMKILLLERCFPGLHRLKIELTSATDPVLRTLDLTPIARSHQATINAIANITDRLAARDAFAGTIIVARGDAEPWTRSWGVADRTSMTRMTADTPMFLASAGKMFTGVAVLQLVEAGKIELDAPLGRYLTNYPNADMARVTIRQLLSHRGGTGDIGILGRLESASRATVRTIDDIVRLNGSRPPAFPPGSRDDYSNYGFILLGAVIEQVTGGSYQDYVAEHIFRPAGMEASGFPDRDHLQGVAIGYTTFFGEEPRLVPNSDILPWRGASAGGGVASPNDMLRFFRALKAGRLLSPAMFRLATTVGDTRWYGMGFVVEPGEHPHWGHGGMSYGMDIATTAYSETDTIFICMAARDSVCNRLIYAYHFRAYGLTE